MKFHKNSLKILLMCFFLGVTFANSASIKQISALLKDNRLDEAERLSLDSLQNLKNEHGDGAIELLPFFKTLGLIYAKKEKYQEAEKHYLEALTIGRKFLHENDPDIASMLNNIGYLYKISQNYEKSLQYFQDALLIFKKIYGDAHLNYASQLVTVAGVLKDIEKYQESEQLYNQALEIRVKELGENNSKVGVLFHYLGELAKVRGKLDNAIINFTKAYSILEITNGKEDANLVYPLDQLAFVYKEKGDLEKAEAFYRRVLDLKEKNMGNNNLEIANTLNNLGVILIARKNQKAEEFLKRALDICEKELGKSDPRNKMILDNLADFYIVKGDVQTAEKYKTRSSQLSKK